MITSTHTYAVLKVSQSTYNEIREKLQTAGYDHAFHRDSIIDMHGIAIQEDETIGKVSTGPGKGKFADPSRRYE